MVSQDSEFRTLSTATLPAAPLDRGELAAALRPFGESRMLPRAAYVDPAVFAWEQRHFFDGGWMCVGRSEQLPEPGDQRGDRDRRRAAGPR
jgi:Rieske 2Fe-2S family protein